MLCSVPPLWTLNASSQSIVAGTLQYCRGICVWRPTMPYSLSYLLDVFVYKHLCAKQLLNGLMKPKSKGNEEIQN